MLPDDVLLEIFDFYTDLIDNLQRIQEWMTLAHVCRRWRSVVFQSPRRLNLQLLCRPTTPVRDTLEIWPPLPLIICDLDEEPAEVDNIIAVLERNNRVCQIRLNFLSSLQLEYITDSAAMNEPFLELTGLHLRVIGDKPGPILPDSLLGGTTPRLRYLYLQDVLFPGLPKLLLSATNIIKLDLDIPPSGYLPPEPIATSRSA